MARELDSVQAERAGRSHISPVSLVKITTYTEHTAATVDKVFYFSDKPTIYDYGNTGTDQFFLAVILGGGDFFSGLGHVTDPEDMTSFEQGLDLHCSNAPINGKASLAELLQDHNLEGASIQIAEIFLPSIDSLPIDLSSYTGDEHTVHHRGRINRVAPITEDRLTIQCGPALPTMADEWNYAQDGSLSNPLDVGQRLPRIYGEAVHTPLVSKLIGFISTFVDDIDATENNVNKSVTDASGLPTSGTFILGVDDEWIECSYVDAQTVKIESGGRGVGFTSGAIHVRGSYFIEVLDDARWVISDRPSVSVGDIYTVNRNTGGLVRVEEDETVVDKDLADTTTVAGQTVTSLGFIQGGATRQQPLTCTGTGVGDPNLAMMDRVGAEEGVNATYGKGDSDFAITFTFQDIGTISTQTIYLDLTRHAGTADVVVKCGAVTVGTVYYASLPAAGSAPARFEFTTSETGNVWSIDPGSGTNVRVYNVERDCDIIREEEDQEGSSASTNISPDNSANVIDGSESTFQAFTGATGEYIQVVFPDPGYTYDSQRIRVFARFDNQTFQLEVNTVDAKDGRVTDDESIPMWHEYETDKIGETIKLDTDHAQDQGEVYLIERTVIREVSPADVALGEQLYADVDGIAVPSADVKTWAEGEDFDDGTWSVSGCTVAVDTSDKVEGTGSQKMIIAEPSSVIETDAVNGDWTPTDATVSAVSGEGHLEGTGCIEGVSTSAVASAVLVFDDAAVTIDLTDTGSGVGSLAFDFKIKKNGSTGFIVFDFGNDLANRWIFFFDTNDFDENTWYTVILNPQDYTNVSGTPDATDIDYFIATWNVSDRAVDAKIYIDNFRVYRNTTAVIQNNAVGPLDLTVPQANYRLSAKPDSGVFNITGLRAFISDDAWSGSTLGTDYRRITFPEDELTAAAWAVLESESTLDQNSVTHSSIDTVRIEVDIEVGSQLQARLDGSDFNIRVDNLEIADTLDGAWKGTVGAVMSHPADIIRHWIEVVGGEDYDSTSYDGLYTALGASAKWGFDARSMGFTWEEVLQRMAFEARCNIVAVEKSTGREWKMLSAGNDYGFGSAASSAVITQTHALSDVGRDMPGLASYFSFRYAFDHSLPGSGTEEGFTKALFANPSASDVPITAALITAAAQRFGARDSGPVAFRAIQDEATAQDVAGYIVQERMANDRRVYQLEEVAWFDALPYDVGDIVSITAPWSSSATTCRITSMAKAFLSNAWTITAVEVLATGTRTP